ncbi:MAG: Xaa-Pro dipeptidase [Methanoregula sp. SKADARSKE-2]|nr:MAG: Xaa-Pro dipeptidase [Methanoregula sp. SKADARSKE-2]
MHVKVPQSELDARIRLFRARMEIRHPGWELAVISSKVNLYYFTGTIQDSVLLIPADGDAVLWVRRSFTRATDESLFPQIRSMTSYRDAAGGMGDKPETVHLESDKVTITLLERLRKYFAFTKIVGIDGLVGEIRSVKSRYEIEQMKRAGEIHRRVLEELAPRLFREGMSEAEFSSEIYTMMIREGHHGIVRFGISEAEIVLGLIGFGDSSIYPTYLDSPGGTAGLCPAVPLLGSRTRKLRRGDLVFCDIGCGYNGYHTDKTMTYLFGGSLPDEVVDIHRRCVEVQDATSHLLCPGAIPSEIYETITGTFDPAFFENFMGYGTRRAEFLGHGIGLEIAENPVIARGFDEPLQEGMVIALEPKKGIRGIGMVGTENTFLVTASGGKSITGCHSGLIRVG